MSEIITTSTTFFNALKFRKVSKPQDYVKIYKKVNKETDIENQKTEKVNCFI